MAPEIILELKRAALDQDRPAYAELSELDSMSGGASGTPSTA
jgi:hypothetical protein